MDYPGKVITKTQVTPTQTSASGNWTLDDQAAAIKNNNWPVALVPNPISRSLRFNSADSAYLNWTPASAGNRQTWTWSGWIKRSGLAAVNSMFFAQRTSGTDGSGFFFTSSDTIRFYSYNGASYDFDYITTQVFRDVGAWYHLVFVLDTTNATSTDRVRIYVNGTRITAWGTSTAPSLNYSGYINQASIHRIGSDTTLTYYSNQYLTEINFIDGQALTPSDFGLTNPQTGQWIPKKYTGTYGTNGFYLNFKDATSTTTLGYDYSGNANNWTTNNFSVTAGSGNDSLTDVPTPWVAYNTTGDVGGVIRGNYATLNPLDANSYTESNGNLDLAIGAGVYNISRSTIGVSSGKWYAEVLVVSATGSPANAENMVGVCRDGVSITNYVGGDANGWGYFGVNGNKFNNGSGSAYGASYTVNDVIGIALDLDAGTLVFYKNGVSQGTAYSSLSGTFYFGFSGTSSAHSRNFSVNFGQRPFAYTPPAGFRSLCTTNLPATTIGFGLTNQGDDYFNAVLYSGNGTSQTIDTGLQPDFIWIKRRNGAAAHTLTDSVRGISKQLFSNLTDAEQTDADSGVTAISSSSITLGDNNLAVGSVNGSGSTYVAWNWKAAGSTVSNTAGSITSTVSANTTAGFSIVTYTGNGANATVGHGLGVAPRFVLTKSRSQSIGWGGYHASLGATNGIFLEETSAAFASVTYWNDTAPTSSVFTIGTNGRQNQSSATYVAYCFAAVAGYSAFGSYTGNGSTDGPFVYLGFRTRYVMIKRTDAASAVGWFVWDTARGSSSGGNVVGYQLYPNLSNAESSSSTNLDILSNGFKIRDTYQDFNASGGTFIYAAFAESPFQFANAR